MGGERLQHANWMVSDYLMITTLLAAHKKFDPHRFRHFEISDLQVHHPNGSFIFGEAGCDRLIYPVPPCLLNKTSDYADAGEFMGGVLLSLQSLSATIRESETLVLVIIGHGDRERLRGGEQTFRLIISTDGTANASGYIRQWQFEAAVRGCRGKVVVFSNSCYSGLLKSSCWHLYCAATATQTSSSLSESTSGCFRGSAFMQCLVSVIAKLHGINVPCPRQRPRDVHSTVTPLPHHPPEHSFTAGTPSVHRAGRLHQTLIEEMRVVETHLLFPSGCFYVSPAPKEPEATLPFGLTTAVIRRVVVRADPLNVHHEFLGVEGGPMASPEAAETTPTSSCGRVATTLTRLLPFYLLVAQQSSPPLPGIVLSRQYMDNPDLLSAAEANSLASSVASRHAQSVVVQCLAMDMGWAPRGATVKEFLAGAEPWGTLSRWQLSMYQHGADLDYLFDQIMEMFHRYFIPCSSFSTLDDS
ncbi:hypothetical protein FB45DRAFT_896515 [Roridomyces roridus]|uniref:Uncharacterized protein n=1 Tax=Roridomyces roridus TaxID=1738132 RepID=A0AAD7CB65_9AGAR|nr:hypothetical protein FB45DRAFT_896515 [Roridomyces roridus]